MRCPLCGSENLTPYHTDRRREYLCCEVCQLVFVPPVYHLNQEQEKAEYDKHDNSQLDEGYARFLNRAVTPLAQRLTTLFGDDLRHLNGLDFGCGEGAFLSQLAFKQGLKMDNYDLYYHPNHELLNRQYDFITLTEVIEHIASPRDCIAQLNAMLSDKAVLLMMTKRVLSRERFANWHYKQDPTHICFYSEATLHRIAEQYSWAIELVSNDIVVFYQNKNK